MLARLQGIESVIGAGIEGSGRYAVLELAPGADVERCCGAALDALGGVARLLTLEEAEQQRAARARGERWYRADDAIELSYLEGRVLASRLSGAVAGPLRLGAPEVEQLGEELRLAVWSYLESVHRGELPAGRFFEAWPELAQLVARRCAGLVPDRERGLLDALLEQFPRGRQG